MHQSDCKSLDYRGLEGQEPLLKDGSRTPGRYLPLKNQGPSPGHAYSLRDQPSDKVFDNRRSEICQSQAIDESASSHSVAIATLSPLQLSGSDNCHG